MAMGMMQVWLAMVMTVGQGPTELLDLVPTQDYWRIQGVEVTIKNMQAQLDAKADEKAEGNDVRRLMAIRALGELKSAESIPALTQLAESKELFVADYARRAIAAAGGKKYKAAEVSKALRMKDVNVLPAGTAMVAQFVAAPGGGPVDMTKVLGTMGPMGEQFQKEGGMDQLLKPLLDFGGKVGNLRIDSLTYGVSGEIDNDKGFVVVVARGQYDAKRCAAALKEAMKNRDELRIENVAGIDVYRPDEEVALLLVSNEVLALVAGPREEELPVDALARALKTGKGTLRDNEQLAKAIDATDKTGRIWGAVALTETYRGGSPVFAPFQSASLSAKAGKGETTFTLVARGSDKDHVAEAVVKLNEHLGEAREEMTRTMERMPMLEPMAKFLNSITVEQAKTDVTVTAKLPGQGSAGMLLAPMMMFGMNARSAPNGPVAEEAQPVPPPAAN